VEVAFVLGDLAVLDERYEARRREIFTDLAHALAKLFAADHILAAMLEIVVAAGALDAIANGVGRGIGK